MSMGSDLLGDLDMFVAPRRITLRVHHDSTSSACGLSRSVQAKGRDILKHPQRAQSAATMQEVVHNTAAIRQGQADAEHALQVTHLS